MSKPEPKPSDFPRPNSNDVAIAGLDLVDTCTSHPEQYDVFAGCNRVGYIRLRCGRFYVRRASNLGIDFDGEPLFETFIERQPDYFTDESARRVMLTESVEHLLASLASTNWGT